MSNYRDALRDNLKRLLGPNSPKSVRAYYLDGLKKGKPVAPRAVQYMLERDGPSPSLDLIQAVAHYLGLQAWQMLVPGCDPRSKPVVVENPEERALLEGFRAHQQLQAEESDEERSTPPVRDTRSNKQVSKDRKASVPTTRRTKAPHKN